MCCFVSCCFMQIIKPHDLLPLLVHIISRVSIEYFRYIHSIGVPVCQSLVHMLECAWLGQLPTRSRRSKVQKQTRTWHGPLQCKLTALSMPFQSLPTPASQKICVHGSGCRYLELQNSTLHCYSTCAIEEHCNINRDIVSALVWFQSRINLHVEWI